MSVPLLRPPNLVVGVLNVHARDAGHFADDILLARLEEVASLLAGIVDAALLHEQLRIREQDLERFTVRTIELQELDRRRIAGDIHDGISQRLVSAWYHLRAAGSITADEAALKELGQVEFLLSSALDEARRAITGLRPSVLDDLGLTAAIGSLAASASGFAVELDLQECNLPPHVETSVYRITQEALQNIAKHAAATRVELSLHRDPDGQVVLTVTDDGSGFDPAIAGGPTSFGLIGMHERANLLGASLVVKSRSGQGTRLTLALPPSAWSEGRESHLGL